MKPRPDIVPGEPVIFHSLAEMPPLPVSLAPTLNNKTGSWHYIRPFYEDKTPPCSHACPAGSDVVGYIGALREGAPAAAWQILVAENPLPGVCGRVCPHPCESACNRGDFGGSIAIHALERFLADEAAAHSWHPPLPQTRRPERIAIVGSGPAGLSCAYHLARLGYQPTVFEAENNVGGMLRYAIPTYRLPRAVVDREVAAIESLGVQFMLNSRLGDSLSLRQLHEFAAVFLAPGQGLSHSLDIPGDASPGVTSGLAFLRRVATGQDAGIGRRVLVVGGGNTALDAARSALRLGAGVTVLYRRTENQMPAIAEEVEEARAEGVRFRFLTAPLQVLSEGKQLTALRCCEMRLGDPDASGRARPLPIPGTEFDLPADTVIAATGQSLDVALLQSAGLHIEHGHIVIDQASATALPGVFAGGDAATGAGTVAHAIGSGKRAALAIDAMLHTGQAGSFPPLDETVHAAARAASRVVVRAADINPDYIESLPRPTLPQRPIAERTGGFAEVNLGLTSEVAAQEAARCISCGTCLSCDTCLIFCPDVAIARRPGGGYTIAYDYCKGCGVCAQECPRAALSMEEEGQ